jgi:hypothetical protein
VDLNQCRKLDLWSFLDEPRRRLQKYPLLIKEIIKHSLAVCSSSENTPSGGIDTAWLADDSDALNKALHMMDAMIQSVEKQAGQAKLRHLNQLLLFSDRPLVRCVQQWRIVVSYHLAELGGQWIPADLGERPAMQGWQRSACVFV